VFSLLHVYCIINNSLYIITACTEDTSVQDVIHGHLLREVQVSVHATNQHSILVQKDSRKKLCVVNNSLYIITSCTEVQRSTSKCPGYQHAVYSCTEGQPY